LAREWKPQLSQVAPGEDKAGQPPVAGSEVSSSGTGFFVSGQGHIVTNAHVVEGCISVRSSRGELTKISADDASDLALYIASEKPDAFARLRGSRGPRVGESVVAVGFPLNGLLSSDPIVTTGIISALSGLRNDRRSIQIAAPVQPGNSGGPLLGEHGSVVGVVVGKLNAIKVAEAIGDIPQNVNFAVSLGTLQSFLNANDVPYVLDDSQAAKSPTDIAAEATRYTVLIECVTPRGHQASLPGHTELPKHTPPPRSSKMPPIHAQSNWVTFKNEETKGQFKIFRRYAYLGPSFGFPNLIMFNCSQDVSKAPSYLTFVLPKAFQPVSFDRDAWLPKLDVRFLIDGHQSILLSGEYLKSELYFDLNTDTIDDFDKLLVANTLALNFGEKNDIIEFNFMEKMDALFSAYVTETGGTSQLGAMTKYAQSGSGGMGDACRRYQSNTSLKSESAKNDQAALPPPTQLSNSGLSQWEHNGSVVYLTADGAKRRFYYDAPRAGLDAIGVKRGTLLFEGRKDGDRYSGTAYLFSQKCGLQAYAVSGPVASDQSQITITLSGQAPRLDATCKQVGLRNDNLVFRYRANTK
jgi:hypothetical protein